jgi:hypothetical protein
MKPDVIDLEGAIDVHFHPYPDLIPRLTDDRGVVARAQELGMQALVLKCHFESTVGRAYAMDQLFDGIRVFGGIVLNYCHGGINPDCVEASIGLGAKEIWMPTVDSDYHAEVYGSTGDFDVQKGGKERKEGVRAVESGKLTLPGAFQLSAWRSIF